MWLKTKQLADLIWLSSSPWNTMFLCTDFFFDRHQAPTDQRSLLFHRSPFRKREACCKQLLGNCQWGRERKNKERKKEERENEINRVREKRKREREREAREGAGERERRLNRTKFLFWTILKEWLVWFVALSSSDWDEMGRPKCYNKSSRSSLVPLFSLIFFTSKLFYPHWM